MKPGDLVRISPRKSKENQQIGILVCEIPYKTIVKDDGSIRRFWKILILDEFIEEQEQFLLILRERHLS